MAEEIKTTILSQNPPSNSSEKSLEDCLQILSNLSQLVSKTKHAAQSEDPLKYMLIPKLLYFS